MRGSLPVTFLFLGISLVTSTSARVLDVHSEIRVAKSGELTVTERITVEAHEKTGALQRELPPGSLVVEVIRNGHPERYALDDGMRLRAGGDALPAGRHLYQITYRCPRRIAFLPDHDALHWNLKGAGRVTAEVILPSSVPAREIKVEASGGSCQGGGICQTFIRNGRAAFRGQGDIGIVVRFPKGVVAEPAIDERARWFFSDYFGAVLVLALIALTAGFLIQARKLSRT